MLQLPAEIELLGLGFLVIGVLFVVAAILSLFAERRESGQIAAEKKGVILIGPIPIVWGYGKKGWAIAFAVALVLWVVLILVF